MSDQVARPHDEWTPPDGTPHDDLPAYAIGILDAAESAAFEAHLAACGWCTSELAAQRALGELLPRGLTAERPPAGARARLLARARSEAGMQSTDVEPSASAATTEAPTQHVDPQTEQEARADSDVVPSPAPTPLRRAPVEPISANLPLERPRRRRFRLASLGWAAALLFVLLGGLFAGAWGATGPHASPMMELQARLPGGQVLQLAGTGVPVAKARLFVVNNGQQAELAVDRLPPLPANRVYQLWFAEPGQPIRTGGTFLVDSRGDAVARVSIPAPLERMRAVAVTEEPAPGSPGPTGPHLLDWEPQ